jgi:Type I phosphodiesterase / nucleotide pyrophosphatase
MKYLIASFLLFAFAFPSQKNTIASSSSNNKDSTTNIFIITIDGYRWQELFNGADSAIIANPKYTADAEMIETMYGGHSAQESRKNLMPFMWNVIAKKGQLYGNRNFDNNVNVSNPYALSYSGYSEMFTGNVDLSITTNNKNINANKNIFEYLNSKEAYKGSIALFTSWDVFPFILNEKRSGIEINSGYENIQEENSYVQRNLNIIQTNIIENKEHTRQDMLTFIAAKEYLQQYKPKIFYLGLGETDEYAHQGNYDMYLQKANETDRIISELWHWAQTTEGYKNNTTFIITTDHGRGKSPSNWTSHGMFTRGSSQTWLALLGKNITALGEVKTNGQLFQKQLAQTIAKLLGEEFSEQKEIETSVAAK